MVDLFDEQEKRPFVPATINFSNINKAALDEVSGAVVDKVMAGDESALETYVKAKALAEVAGNIQKELKELAKDEAGLYEPEESKILGCEFNVRGGSTSYSFDHDETWAKLEAQMSSIREQMKEREKKMIDATRYAELIDEETGEVIPPAKVKGHGASALVIKIPKA